MVKKKGDTITQPDIELATASSYSGDDISDDDYIVFEDNTEDSSDADPRRAPHVLSLPTLVINIHRTIHAVRSSSRRVRFNDEIITHVVEIEARKGYWIEDRLRFQQRCTSVRDAISFIFDEIHRRKMRLIVNLSDTLRGAVMQRASGGYGEKQTDRSLVYEARPKVSFNTFPCSNISRDHTTIMRPMHVATKSSYDIALPTPTWWRS
jgi:hypothetical protein